MITRLLPFLFLALLTGCNCHGNASFTYPTTSRELAELLDVDDPVREDGRGVWTNIDACKLFCDAAAAPEEKKDWKSCRTHKTISDANENAGGAAGAGGESATETEVIDGVRYEVQFRTSCGYEFPAKCNNGGNYL